MTSCPWLQKWEVISKRTLWTDGPAQKVGSTKLFVLINKHKYSKAFWKHKHSKQLKQVILTDKMRPLYIQHRVTLHEWRLPKTNSQSQKIKIRSCLLFLYLSHTFTTHLNKKGENIGFALSIHQPISIVQRTHSAKLKHLPGVWINSCSLVS